MTELTLSWSPVESSKHPETNFFDRTCPVVGGWMHSESNPHSLSSCVPRHHDRTWEQCPPRVRSLPRVRVWSSRCLCLSLGSSTGRVRSPCDQRFNSFHFTLASILPTTKSHHSAHVLAFSQNIFKGEHSLESKCICNELEHLVALW
jgi:hypothetical protein